MRFLLYSALGLLGITVIFILFTAIRGHRPFKTLLLSAVCGIAALTAIDITTRFTGVHIAVNEWTVGTSALLGIPGVFGLLIMKFF